MKKFALLASCMFASSFANLSCLDREGNPTDWFVNIKFPRSIRKAGDKYAYLHPAGGNSFKVIEGANIDGPNEALTRTFNLISSVPASDKQQVLFNDEKPGEDAKSSGAHAKGVIAYETNSKTGVYVMHSLPGFPKVSEAGVINPNVDEDNDKYGQHIYCISLNEASFNTLVEHLPVERPNIYYSSGVFSELPKRLKDLSKISQIVLGNSEKISMFTKAPKFAGLIFEDIVIPQIDSPLAVESWGRPYQKPSCLPEKHSVNINQLAFNAKDTWSHGSDHSKWAITTAKTKIACFCDMNRMESQAKRGGSCLCSENTNIHHALSSLVVDTDKCEVLTL